KCASRRSSVLASHRAPSFFILSHVAVARKTAFGIGAEEILQIAHGCNGALAAASFDPGGINSKHASRAFAVDAVLKHAFVGDLQEVIGMVVLFARALTHRHEKAAADIVQGEFSTLIGLVIELFRPSIFRAVDFKLAKRTVYPITNDIILLLIAPGGERLHAFALIKQRSLRANTARQESDSDSRAGDPKSLLECIH